MSHDHTQEIRMLVALRRLRRKKERQGIPPTWITVRLRVGNRARLLRFLDSISQVNRISPDQRETVLGMRIIATDDP